MKIIKDLIIRQYEIKIKLLLTRNIMIRFRHKSEIQIFTLFATEFADNKVFRNEDLSISIVVPGDYLESIFENFEPFSCNCKCIWYNERIVQEIGLDKEECYACIAHEIGHLLDKRETEIDQQVREKNADKFACNLGLSKYMISALEKMIDYYQQERINQDPDFIGNMRERIIELNKM